MSEGNPQLEQMLAEQRALTVLGLHDLSQRWEQQPDLHVLQVGEGQPNSQTIRGNPENAFHGVAVYNRTGKNVVVGFNAGAAVGGPMVVPPGALLVWPAQYANLSIAADTTGRQEPLVVLRLRYPPQPSLTQIVPSKASGIAQQPEDILVALASVQLAAANVNRRGIEIVNRGAAAVRLALGEPALAKHGLWLSSGGGSWDGRLSGALWLGSIAAICDAGESTVAVVEA